MDTAPEIAELEGRLASVQNLGAWMLPDVGRLTELYLQSPGDAKHLARAIELLQTAQEVMKAAGLGCESPFYPKFRHLEAMKMRFADASSPNVLGLQGDAAAIDREAYQISLAKAPIEAIVQAREWGEWAWKSERWDEAAEAYARAGKALRGVVLRHAPRRDDRLAIMREGCFGARCFFAYLKQGEVEKAVVEFEKIHSVAFGANEQFADLARMREAAPEAAARVDAALARQSKLQRSLLNKLGFDELGNLSEMAEAARKEVDAAVVAARTADGFSSFARVPAWEDVAAAATHPLAYVALTDKGLAIAIVKREEGERVQSAYTFNDVTLATFVERTQPFFAAEFDGRGDPHDALMDALQWLTEAVTRPVLMTLAEMGIKNAPFYLFPMGALSYLPIHAGCIRHDSGLFGFLVHPRNVAFGYSARSLIRSKTRKNERVHDGALVIDNPLPLPPGFAPLQMSTYEAAEVLRHVSGVSLDGEKATVGNVTAALPEAKLAHFICHGFGDRRLNYSGALLLANGEELIYEQICDLNQIKARLVVLSACHTASVALQSETIVSLPAAFLAAGAGAVIGTFWRADDMAAYLLMTRFYELWRNGEAEPREALGDAQQWLIFARAEELREKVPVQALQAPAGRRLRETESDSTPYQHPWFWAGFFVAGV